MVNANASPLQTQSPILKGMQKKKACAESYMLFTTIKMTLKGLSATTKKKGHINTKNWQTIVGSAYRHTDNTVSCHHIVKHDVLLEKRNKKQIKSFGLRLDSHDQLHGCFHLSLWTMKPGAADRVQMSIMLSWQPWIRHAWGSECVWYGLDMGKHWCCTRYRTHKMQLIWWDNTT